jgi:hypothetical protein
MVNSLTDLRGKLIIGDMKNFERQIFARIEDIVACGEKIKQQKSHEIDTSDYAEWLASTQNLIEQVAGKNSSHYVNFIKELNEAGHPQYYVDYGNGILRALKKDLEGGLLGKIENLVAAEVFSDFFDMAEHLLNQGYKDPAAFLGGATLEEGLRRISTNNGIAVKADDDISSLATKLIQGGTINEIQRKQIMAWKAIRDNADHGNFNAYTTEQISLMLVGVRDFFANLI